MTSGEVLQAIARCADVTESMLRAATTGDWAGVAHLEAQRRAHVADIRIDGVETDGLDAVREGLRALLAMDGRLVELTVQGRGLALAALRAARGPARARAAYHRAAD